jgi:hypothetical protein
MYISIHPATHSVCGLTGGVHKDYRADVVSVGPATADLEFIDLLLTDDMPKPPGALRLPTLSMRVTAPVGLTDYGAYRIEVWRQIEMYIRSQN